jgi:hypothetical protein
MKSKSILIVGGCVVSFSIGVLVGGRIVKRAIMRELVEQTEEMKDRIFSELSGMYDPEPEPTINDLLDALDLPVIRPENIMVDYAKLTKKGDE